jgi:hypothetical protein
MPRCRQLLLHAVRNFRRRCGRGVGVSSPFYRLAARRSRVLLWLTLPASSLNSAIHARCHRRGPILFESVPGTPLAGLNAS